MPSKKNKKIRDLERLNDSQCLDLRQIHERRVAKLVSIARSKKNHLVDLKESAQKQLQEIENLARKEREAAKKSARHLVDLSQGRAKLKQKKFFPEAESIIEPKKKKPSKPAALKKTIQEEIEPLAQDLQGFFPEYFDSEEVEKDTGVNDLFSESDNEASFDAPVIDLLNSGVEIESEKPVKPLRAKKAITAKTKKSPAKSLVVFSLLIVFLAGSVGASATIQKALDSQASIVGKASEGAESLRSAAAYMKQQNFLQAITDFERGAKYFQEAEADIKQIGELTSQLLKIVPKGRAAVALVEAGQSMSEAGQSFARAIGYFRQVSSLFSGESANSGELTLTEALEKSQVEFAQVSGQLDLANNNLAKVSENSLPAAFRDDFVEAKEILTVLRGATDYFMSFSEQFSGVLGNDGPKRYLVLLANSDEIRGSVGGFPGSYLILDFADGQIQSMDLHDIYEIRGQQFSEIVPPEPFRLITGNFELQDVAGWWIDYPMSAQKIMEYYQKSLVGTTVDGVWTINSDIIPDLLAITGPVTLREYGVTIDENNYLEMIENRVESDEARATGHPKKIVEDFMTKLLSILLSKDRVDWLSVMGIFDQAVAEKKLQMYFADDELQDFAKQNNATGGVKEADDYLAVYTYNIGGGKTSQDISEEIHQVRSVNEDGSMDAVVTINRQHRSFEDLDDLSQVKNVSWLKVALPKDAVITSVNGVDEVYPAIHTSSDEAVVDEAVDFIEQNTTVLDSNPNVFISEESGKKIVGFWQGLGIGEDKTVEISYEVPRVIDLEKSIFDSASGYTSVIQTQPGQDNVHIESRVTFPAGTEIVWQEASGAFINTVDRTLSWTVDNPMQDIVVSSVLQK